MKSRKWPAALAGLILAVILACAALADGPLPAEIEGLPAGTEILQAAHWEGPGDTWFVLARMPDGSRMLLCFELRDGTWVQAFHTGAAVPQGNTGVDRLLVTDQVRDFVQNRAWPGPVLMILTEDGSYTSYQRSGSGQWNLFRVFRQDEQVYLDFDDESVTFRTPVDQDHSRVETVHGRFERDLRKVDLNAIPAAPEEARKLLEEAPPAEDPARP